MQLWKKLFLLDARLAITGLVISAIYLIFTLLPLPAATPFLKFGMFSERNRTDTTYEVLRLYVNGQPQIPRYYTIMQWDDLAGPYYQWKKEQDSLYQPIIYKRKLFKKLGADPDFILDQQFKNRLDTGTLIKWYNRQINIIYGQKPDSFRISVQVFRWQNQMIPVSAEKNLLTYE
jgi:hypothetical protein